MYYPPLSVKFFPINKIDIHEALHFRSLQSLQYGATYYINSSSNQYGPGSLKFNQIIINSLSDMSLQGLKHSNYLFHTFLLFLTICLIFLIFNFLTSFLLSVAFLSISPAVNMFYIEAGNIPIGFWGWGNLARYISVLVLPLLLYAYDKSQNRIFLVSIGFFATLFSWLSQENLLASILLITFFFFVKFLFPWAEKGHSIFQEIALVLSGALPTFLVLCFEWIKNGYLLEAYKNYFLVPRSVSSGYSGSTWIDTPNIFYVIYQLSPFMIIGLNLFMLIALYKFEKSDKYLIKLVLYLNFGYSVSFIGSLFRSDQSHFINTSINLVPIVFFFFYALFPLIRNSNSFFFNNVLQPSKVIFPILSFILTFLLFSIIGVINQNPLSITEKKISNIAQFLDPKNASGPTTYFERIGYLKNSEMDQICCPELGITFSDLNYISQELSTTIGASKVYISSRIPYIYPEVFYFVGNLNPAESRYERLGLQVNDIIMELDTDFFKSHSKDLEFIVTLTSDNDIDFIARDINLNYLFVRNVTTSSLSLSVYSVK